MKKTLTLFLLLALAHEFSGLPAQTTALEEFSANYNWLVGFEHSPGDERLFVFQKDGYLRICNASGSIGSTFLDLSAKVNNSFNNEHGLVGVAFHPNYASNGFFYVFYNQLGTGDCKISRFTRSPFNANAALLNSEVLLLTFPHPMANHVGGCLKFGPDGYLYAATGDGGGAGDPNGSGQNLGVFLGKILRLDVDLPAGSALNYEIPPDNPFVNTPGALPEIFAYGLRNPWRFTFDRLTGDLWIADVGQDEREEVNFIPAGSPGGQNFGWSCMEGTLAYNAAQCDTTATYTPPLWEYDHSAGDCSISGGVVYRGGEWADLFGKYLFTDFCTGRVWALSKNGDLAEVAETGNFNENDFTLLDENQKGELFMAGFYSNKIWKIKSENCLPVAFLTNADTLALDAGSSVYLHSYPGVSDMTYQWLLNGNPLAGAQNPTLAATQSGTYTLVVTNPDENCSAVSNPVVVLDVTGSVFISGQEGVCTGVAYTYSVPAVAGASYEWGFDGVVQVSGLGTSELQVEWANVGLGFLFCTVFLPNGSVLESNLKIIYISLNNLPASGEVSDVTCPGGSDGSVNLYNSAAASYLWSTGDTTEDLSNLPAGTYSVTATNSNGCIYTGTFEVLEPDQVTVQFGVENVSCAGLGDGAIFADSIPGNLCGWSWGPLGMEELPAGTYFVTLTDCNGCSSVQPVEVGEPLPLSLNFSAFPPAPGQSDGSITANASGGTPPFAYLWSGGEITKTITGLSEGTYSVTVTDDHGCTISDTIFLGVPLAADEVERWLGLSVFPNPASGELSVSFTLPEAAEVGLEVLDALGRRVAEVLPFERREAGVFLKKMNASGWQPAVYLLAVRTERGVFFRKIVVAR